MLVSYHFSFPSSLKTLTAQMFDKIVQLVASDGDVVSKTISVQEQSKQDHVVFVSYPSGITEKNIWVANFFLPKKKLAFTDHLVIFTIFGGWVGPPHYKNSKKLLSDQ